jgi:hypothetical protein
MAGRWVCRSCWAANEEAWDNCLRCRAPRGAEASASPASPSTVDVGNAGSPWWRRVPIRFAGIAIFAGIALVGVVTAATRDESGAITGAGTLHIVDVRVGDCFDLNEGRDVEEVGEIRAIPCDEPHTYEAYFATDLAPGSYPSRTALDAETEAACLPSFEPYVGRSYETSELYVTTFEPTPDGWRQGDRGLLCVVSNYDGLEPLTGSVRSSDR